MREEPEGLHSLGLSLGGPTGEATEILKSEKNTRHLFLSWPLDICDPWSI